MGDAGEGLIDQDSRIQERMEELERQLESTTHERRRDSIGQAMAELDRRIEEANASL